MTDAPIQPAPRDVEPGRLFVDGASCDAASGETFSVHYPATGEVLTTCAEAAAEDVDRAVAAARRAYDETWSKSAPAERGRLLRPSFANSAIRLLVTFWGAFWPLAWGGQTALISTPRTRMIR